MSPTVRNVLTVIAVVCGVASIIIYFTAPDPLDPIACVQERETLMRVEVEDPARADSLVTPVVTERVYRACLLRQEMVEKYDPAVHGELITEDFAPTPSTPLDE